MMRAFAEIFSKNVKCHFMVVFYNWATLPIFFDTASTGAVVRPVLAWGRGGEIQVTCVCIKIIHSTNKKPD